ncbi:MAG TPA: condensation domain-containing protein, partial [Solirubrobacterales bacterium]|nr:condensation domain-containing protein [Solirubrobacterales bacterium]
MAPGPEHEEAPLSVVQEAIWYTSRLHPRRLTYNETIPIRKRGSLDAEVLERALRELVRRHESLRTNLRVVDGRPVQVVGEVPDLELPAVDLSHLDPAEAEAAALARVAEVDGAPYDLRRGALVRPLLFRFPEEHRLYLGIHHVAFDGVSLARVLMPELIALYAAFAEGRPSPLSDPPVRYVDYARWEQEWIASPKAER